jgi:3-oxoacyl-[acyl-carrier protein] reductase
LVNLELENKRFLITGASSGIGQAAAKIFAQEGADVVAVYGRNAEGAKATLSAIESAGRRGWIYAIAQEDAEAVAAAAGRVGEEVGRLDGLVLCAGTCTVVPFEELSPQEWVDFLQVNLNGTFFLLNALFPLLADGASVVIVASVSGHTGAPHQAHYAASKAGLLNLAKSAARAYAPRVRVNAIAPGMTLTPMGEGTATGLDPDYARKKLLVGRFAEPEEIAKSIAWLASPITGFMSGATLDINGGRLLR